MSKQKSQKELNEGEKSSLLSTSLIAKEINKLKLECSAYLARGEDELFNVFYKDSVELFKNAGTLFLHENESNCARVSESFSQKYGQDIAQLDNLFKTFCMMKAQVKRVKKGNDNIAEMFYKKHLLRRVFKSWAEEQKKQRYLQQMQDYCEAYARRTLGKNVLKEWNNITMTENRLKIRSSILKRTEADLLKVQREYEGSIKGLEQILEKKLVELRKEEEEHKLLHDKYESMYERRRFQEKEHSGRE